MKLDRAMRPSSLLSMALDECIIVRNLVFPMPTSLSVVRIEGVLRSGSTTWFGAGASSESNPRPWNVEKGRKVPPVKPVSMSRPISSGLSSAGLSTTKVNASENLFFENSFAASSESNVPWIAPWLTTTALPLLGSNSLSHSLRTNSRFSRYSVSLSVMLFSPTQRARASPTAFPTDIPFMAAVAFARR